MDIANNKIVDLYRRLSQVGVDRNTPERRRKYIVLSNSMNLTTLTLIPPYSLLFYCLGIHKLALMLASVFLLFCFYHYLTHRKRYFWSRTLMIFSVNVILGVYGVVLGRESGIHYLYFVFFTFPFLLYSLRNVALITFCCLSSVVPFCLIHFGAFDPVIQMPTIALRIISVALILQTFCWLMLNILYLLKANQTAEENLHEAYQLLQARNRDLEQFAYVASHDLQEPLRTVASYVELLDKQYTDSFDSTARKYMDYIVGSTHRLKKLIKDLLDYSRIGREYKPEKTDIKSVVHETVADLQELINTSGATIEMAELPRAEGYATDLKMLYLNLIGNAIKFRKPGSPIQVRLAAEPVGDYWKFSVKDNGIGIETPYLERIFIIFQRLHNQTEYEGNGIGLAHCKKIVEMHGGNIWVESEYGSGSTFYFTLPA
jgi:signal transduction histidine kinase